MLFNESKVLSYIEKYGPVSVHEIQRYLAQAGVAITQENVATETRRSINRLISGHYIENVGNAKYEARRD